MFYLNVLGDPQECIAILKMRKVKVLHQDLKQPSKTSKILCLISSLILKKDTGEKNSSTNWKQGTPCSE